MLRPYKTAYYQYQNIFTKAENHIIGLTCAFQFSSVQSLSRVWLFVTPWISARQASLFNTNSQSTLRLTSIESVMPSSHLILCHPLLLLPPIPPSIRVFSNESTFHMRWPKYWSFSFSIIPSKEHPGLISFRMDWLDLHANYRVSFHSTKHFSKYSAQRTTNYLLLKKMPSQYIFPSHKSGHQFYIKESCSLT